ncbi:MAG TPA: outer membrane protein assembly factor BamD [Saprospiraceae bacterium]|nr:outer membrane protein assembly factor BamD [Saprospiraceae bacterium]
MGKNALKYILISLGVGLFLFGCKSEYESIRTSGDPELILKKAYEYYDQEEYQRAQSLMELVISIYRGRAEAEDLNFKFAYTFYYQKNYILSTYYFKEFSQTYGASDKKEESDFMSAYSNYLLSPKYRLDQSYTNTAIQELQFFINTYPNSERVDQCNKLIDELRAKLEKKAFEEGKLYFNLSRYNAAVQVYENLLKDFPETENTAEIRWMVIRSNYLLAENSVLQRQEERYQETADLAEEYLQRFGDGEFAEDVQRMKEDSEKNINQLKDVRYQNQSTGS